MKPDKSHVILAFLIATGCSQTSESAPASTTGVTESSTS